MYIVILVLHLAAAFIMSASIIAVISAAYKKNETGYYTSMIYSFGATVVSGAGLLVISANGLGRFCAMMTLYTVVVIAAHHYYLRQLVIETSL